MKGTVKEASYTRYARNAYNYLVPARGGKRGNGLSEKTVSDLFSVLKMILSHASEQGYPAMNTALVRNTRRKKQDVKSLCVALPIFMLTSTSSLAR